MKKLIVWLILLPGYLFAQQQNYNWCFGDSAGIDFNNLSNPVPIQSAMNARGSCASISDTSGNLLLYAATPDGSTWMPGITKFGAVRNFLNDTISNGIELVGQGWYHEVIVIPYPAHDSLFYVFTIGVTGSYYGLYYSVVNMHANGGLGNVIQKNIQLMPDQQADCISAVKHGNGRDWWVIFRRDPQFNPSNEFSTYLVSPGGITNYTQQNVGGPVYAKNADIAFSPTGNKVAVTSYNGLIEILDFDRCTGQLTLEHHIQTGVLVSPTPALWSVAFSPDESRLYITASDTSTLLYQYDLNSTNIAASKDTIWVINYPLYAGGGLKLAPDNKIYVATQYYDGFNFPYPYPDSVYNIYNMNLSVINQPDSLGAACDFQPYSFYLGGKRTYLGLPNNPDYDMPALAGSPCDTLTGITEHPLPANQAMLFVTYIAAWQKLFVNAQNIQGRNGTLQVFDATGKAIYNRALHSPSGAGGNAGGYFTQDINCAAFAKGMYMVSLRTEKEFLTKKFVKHASR